MLFLFVVNLRASCLCSPNFIQTNLLLLLETLTYKCISKHIQTQISYEFLYLLSAQQLPSNHLIQLLPHILYGYLSYGIHVQ